MTGAGRRAGATAAGAAELPLAGPLAESPPDPSADPHAAPAGPVAARQRDRRLPSAPAPAARHSPASSSVRVTSVKPSRADTSRPSRTTCSDTCALASLG